MKKTEVLYPDLTTPEEKEEYTNKREALKSRLEHMKEKEDVLQEKLRQYTRAKKRWGKADSGVKLAGTILGFTFVVGLITCIALGGVGIVSVSALTLAESILTSLGALNGLLTVMVSMRYTKRKKKEFNARIKLIEGYNNKIFYYTQRVKEDGIITIDELKQFDLLIEEFKNKLSELKSFQEKKDNNMTSVISQPETFIKNNELNNKETKKINKELNNKETKKINKEVQKELKQELIFKKKEEIKKNLMLV